MRDDYLKSAMEIVDDPNILINLASIRVKQLRRGHRPLVESLEKLEFVDIALREIAEGKITYELGTPPVVSHDEFRARRAGYVPSSASSVA